MRLRAFVSVCFALAAFGLPVRPAAAQAVCSAGLHKNWDFRAGTPLKEAPALASTGQVTVATQGGYLHALSAEGAFLWSYSTEGGLLSGVHTVGDTRLVAITSSRQVYSWLPNGQLLWSFRAQVKPAQVVASAPRDLAFFVAERYLYALTARGTLAWRAELGADVVSNLRVDSEGAAWLVTADDKLHRVRTPYFHDSWALPSVAPDAPQTATTSTAAGRSTSPPVLLAVSERGALLERAGKVMALAADGSLRWERANIVGATAVLGVDEPMLVAIDTEGDALWLLASTGQEQTRVALAPLNLRSSPELSLSAAGDRLAIGDVEGRLWLYSRAGRWARCTVSFAALLEPTFDQPRAQVVVGAGDGTVMGVGFDGDW